ncbi:MAG: fatty acid desaturase family protein [Acidimicrobiales bacterium]
MTTTIDLTLADGAALHRLHPRLPTIWELGEDLLRLTPGRRRAELLWPPALVAGYWLLAGSGRWLGATVAVVLFFPRFGVLFHDLLHQSLRLSPRWNDLMLSVIGLTALQSGHAIAITHLEHHRHFPGPADPEAYLGPLLWWRALLHGPIYQYRMWARALNRCPSPWRRIAVEAAAHVGLVAGSVMALRWTAAPLLYVALMMTGNSIFPALSVKLLHDHGGTAAQHRTRTIRGRLFSAYFLGLGYHLEHHAYPRVPTRNAAELARRLAAPLAALGVQQKQLA